MMSDRSMRGTRLGTQSLENEHSVIPAAREWVRYSCPDGHETEVPLAVGAEFPVTWACRCGRAGLRHDAQAPEPVPTKPVRTHWDMLLERRSIPELEELLQERLALLRDRGLIQDRKIA